MSTQNQNPDTCGCCEGLRNLTNVSVKNLPGLSAIAYRVGTHASFKVTMQSQLSGQRPLRALTTRDDNDHAIALIDGWAAVADVLTFYQERIANEGYLRTATERRSILELARLIGYELNPGVAASTYLAFTIEQAPGSPPTTTISVGARAQSVPGQDELPQTFETIEEIKASADLSNLKPRITEKHRPEFGDTDLYLKGITTNLKAGDPLLIVGERRRKVKESEKWEFRRIREVKIDAKNDRTYICWDKPLGSRMPRVYPPGVEIKIYALRLRAAIFGHNAMDWRTLPATLRIGEYSPETRKWLKGKYANRQSTWADKKFKRGRKIIYLDAVYGQIVFNSWIVLSSVEYEAELYRVKEIDEKTVADYNMTAKSTRLRISGEHIEKFRPRTATVFTQSEEIERADRPVTTPLFGSRVKLDRKVDGLESGPTFIVSGRPLLRVKVADKTTAWWEWYGEQVHEKPDLSLVSTNGPEQKLKPGDVLDVMGLPEELKSSGKIKIKWHLKRKNGFTGYVTAEPDDFIAEPGTLEDETVGQPGTGSNEEETVSEVVFLDKTEVKDDLTTLVFTTNLKNVYHRESVTLNGNVAKATHGETRVEVLGGGDGSQEFQEFVLKQNPLTYVAASTPTGAETTLKIRVNDVLWKEEPTFFGHGPDERIYITRMNDDGKTRVIFGDGRTGARLPSGQENIKAEYRKGIGLSGLMKAKQISQLMTRPLGLKEVINPVAATGADDPEKRDRARQNAPLTVLTLDRIVSLQDFEDFARAFAGIGKAQATVLWNGEQRMVYITVSAAGGRPVEKGSEPHKKLIEGINAARHADDQVMIGSYDQLKFNVKARVHVDSSLIVEDVMANVVKAIRKAFGFDNRNFGRAVTKSEVMAVIQRVTGVIALDLEHLYFSSPNAEPSEPPPFLPAHTARWDEHNTSVEAAELLTVNTDGITLVEMQV